MENKKLFKYLLKDLSELEEMFTEKDRNSFDELEMEFIQNRVLGAKKLVQMFLERENLQPEIKPVSFPNENKATRQIDFSGGKTEIWVEESRLEKRAVENLKEVINIAKTPESYLQESIPEILTGHSTTAGVVENEVFETGKVKNAEIVENEIVDKETLVDPVIENQEKPVAEIPKQVEKARSVAVQQELRLDDEESVDNHSKRLGDLFSKEKTVNDLISEDFSKLEHKLSNRPVANIHSAIGINDRFQYIRELFEGSVDNFVKTVADLDSMNDIKEAVNYLQTNFRWKKNETSLKFINLVKRRFPNE